jgi:hypothetical protein
MNHSLLMADRLTHTKVVVLALAFATAVIWVGIAARMTQTRISEPAAPAINVVPTPDIEPAAPPAARLGIIKIA